MPDELYRFCPCGWAFVASDPLPPGPVWWADGRHCHYGPDGVVVVHPPPLVFGW